MVLKTYSWAIPKYKITAEEAHKEISKLSEVTPHNIVELAKDENSPLHNEFEWNDTIAGDKYREIQARDMLRCIIVHEENKDDKPTEIRAWVSTTEKCVYDRIEAVVSNETEYENLLKTALKELESFKKKYHSLKELKPIFEAMKEL